MSDNHTRKRSVHLGRHIYLAALFLLGSILVSTESADASGGPGSNPGQIALAAGAVPDLVAISSSPALYPGDLVLWTLTVTNTSLGTTAYGVDVDDVLAGLVRQESVDVTDGCGEYSEGDWEIGSLAPGETCRLWVEVLVNSADTLYRTAETSTTDPLPSNNTVEITGRMIPYPAIAQAQAVVVRRYPVMNRDGDEEKLNRVVLGLFQGANPGNTAVLCSIPTPKYHPVAYTVPKYQVERMWRPCGEGLPFPLHVNDLFADRNGKRIWLSAWGYAGLYYSDDHGISWTAAEPILTDQPTGWKNVYMMAQDAAGVYYISVNNGLMFRSPNGLGGWIQLSPMPRGAADTAWSLVGDPNSPGRLYAGSFGRGVLVSKNGGGSWSELHGEAVNLELITGGGGHVFDLAFSPGCSDALFAATGADVWRIDLTDPGSSWVPTGLKLDPSATVGLDTRALAFGPKSSLDSDPDLWVATWGFGVHRYFSPLAHPGWHRQEIPSLRQLSFVAVDPDGEFVVTGGVGGEPDLFEAAMSTANEGAPRSGLPDSYMLHANWPNPFNPSTTIEYETTQSSPVRLSVHDMLGREVALLVNGVVPAGRGQVRFDASNLTSGVYYYRIETAGQVENRTMVLSK